ncbi:MAG: ATP-binding cassette domain-containing protein [Chloroflexi bacterium]|nr:ATP-binding cassette domain-containing protein [Anaerolineaceae bacterium]NMB87976.1 ATP-binding cassette domain-containing protein [Chloroflexota bacterium]
MTEPLLRVQSLSKRYGNLVALDNVTFQLERGEILGVVGRRGAGKSTLLHLLGGTTMPTGGDIIFQGQKTQFATVEQARRQGIELVYQVPQLLEQLNIVQNIFLGREICWPPHIGIPDWDQMYNRVKDLLADFELPATLLQERIENLNDEQRQIVALSRALCQPFKLLLLDDFLPTLSSQRPQLVLEKIKVMAQQGVGVIISSDNLKHLFDITDRILVLYEGALSAERCTAECTPRDIVELIVGAGNREQVTPIIWALESYHAAQRQTEELFRMQAVLHKSLEASDTLNRELVDKLSKQVKALDNLNAALQETQRRLMTEREEERKSLARELHDQVIQDLLSLNYRLEDLEDDNISMEHRSELSAIRDGIRQVVGDLRQLCRDLRPPTIDNHGLSSAIRSLAQEWADRTGIAVLLNIDPALGRLPEAIELSVFRIVQEGINNVAKHAAAREVQLSLQRTHIDTLQLRIADDGHGIDKLPNLANLSASKHFGLVGISERAALLGGSMRIQSARGGGMVLEVEIPSPYPPGSTWK